MIDVTVCILYMHVLTDAETNAVLWSLFDDELIAQIYFRLLTGKQLLYNYPKIYAHGLPKDFEADNLNVLHAVDGSHVQEPPWNSLITLTSLAGQKFLSFAKYTDFGEGLSII